MRRLKSTGRLLPVRTRLSVSYFRRNRTTVRPNLLHYLGIAFVPQQHAYIVERFGRFTKVLDPGINFLIPFADRIAYAHSLKAVASEIPNQHAVTQDNVHISVSGVLFFQIEDPKRASYNIDKVEYAVQQLAMATMRSELGKISLETAFRDRQRLNELIVLHIQEQVSDWGVKVLRYEIRDIAPPESISRAMELQAVAERKKRQKIIDSEGSKQSEINMAEGLKAAAILEAEGIAQSIQKVAETIKMSGGSEALSLRLAEQYVHAFSNLARKSTTLMLPANVSDPAAMIAQTLAIFGNVSKKLEESAGSTAESSDAPTPPKPATRVFHEKTSARGSEEDLHFKFSGENTDK